LQFLNFLNEKQKTTSNGDIREYFFHYLKHFKDGKKKKKNKYILQRFYEKKNCRNKYEKNTKSQELKMY